jgi:hypothetical protein
VQTAEVSRRLFLEPTKSLPVFLTHREWCKHLRERNQLSIAHRACTETESCIADKLHKASGEQWRYVRREA